jgi:hypothetical protein
MSFLWKKDGAWTTWGRQARQLAEETGYSDEDCATAVIFNWLNRGNVRPLAAYLADGEVPQPQILVYLAGMLDREHIGKLKLKDEHGDIPVEYRFRLKLECVPGKRKRKDNRAEKQPETEMRDRMLAGRVTEVLLVNGDHKEGAYEAVAQVSGEGTDTVKKAYLRFMGRGKPGLSLLKGKVEK